MSVNMQFTERIIISLVFLSKQDGHFHFKSLHVKSSMLHVVRMLLCLHWPTMAVYSVAAGFQNGFQNKQYIRQHNFSPVVPK